MIDIDKQHMRYIFVRVLFAVEMFLVAGIYFYGADGFAQLKQLKNDCAQLTAILARKQREIEQIEQRIIAWNVHPFYKEKMAREQLRMSRAQEVIYVIEPEKQLQA